MLWTITWLGDTRESFKALVRQQLPRWPMPGDAGEIYAKKVERDISLHPIPSPDLPQIEEDCVFAFGPIRVHYHINSERREAMVRIVNEAV